MKKSELRQIIREEKERLDVNQLHRYIDETFAKYGISLTTMKKKSPFTLKRYKEMRKALDKFLAALRDDYS